MYSAGCKWVSEVTKCNLRAPKFQNFSGGACPQTPLSRCFLQPPSLHKYSPPLHYIPRKNTATTTDRTDRLTPLAHTRRGVMRLEMSLSKDTEVSDLVLQPGLINDPLLHHGCHGKEHFSVPVSWYVIRFRYTLLGRHSYFIHD